MTGKEAEETLQRAEITVNKNMVPFDDKSPFVTSGIRLGTPAVTTRGFDESACTVVVGMMDRVLQAPQSDTVRRAVRGEVLELCHAHPLYDFVTA